MKEDFEISARVTYTIKSKDGEFDFDGIGGLERHYEDALGEFIDRMYRESVNPHPWNVKTNQHEFITKNMVDLQTILALKDAIEDLKNPPEEEDDL